MHFLVKTLFVLPLLASAYARRKDYGNDLHCPEDFHVGFVHNSYTYNAPVDKFTNITKSFYDVSWYGGAVVSKTTGTDNVPGATRAGNLDGYFLETLTAYSFGPSGLEYTVRGDPFTYALPNSTAVPVRFSGYVEALRIQGICSGRATYIDVITYVCSADKVTGYDWWYTAHEGVFPALAAKMGATVMAGDCPQETRCYKD
ncbi:hypothetical protein C8F04DRAFT_245776 [Mycena alexandri]|uniref:Uncharacterized protein n=1 Tax=Mycena alexandri TaxID=1745969 RepID=A0AAD6S763_9AGAR|nr:hypothetical protein C8F04DRAFT_245776 [Mycena alexandri]